MKKLFLISCALLSSLLSVAQKEADPVVMTVANEPITRSEFEYNFNKNNTEDVVDKKTVREYADLYAIYKMKVRAALDAKMDTISSFQKEFRHYRDMQIRPLLVPEVVIEQQCQDYYNGMLEMLGGKDLIRPAHILVMVSQKASPQEQEAKRQLADSIYNAIVQGEDFERLALEKSDDTQSAREGGALPWIGPGNTLQEFEDVAYSLQVGEMSKPFLSPVGYHIIKMLDRKQLEPFDTLHPQIHRFMEQRGVHERLASNALDSISKKYAGKYTTEQILDIETERLCNENQELKYLVKEYHDGLLLYELCSTQIWEPAKTDITAMQQEPMQSERFLMKPKG
jgi:peptidyl-prolyl cis-trans isomerase SurA